MAVVYTNDLWTIGSRRISSRSYPEPVTLNDVFAAIKGEDGSNVAAIEAFSFWFCENYPDGFEAGEALLCQEPPSVERTKQLYISLVPKDVRYEGAVLWDGERNYYDDSDFYAVVWDEAEQRVRFEEYATTRFAGGGTCQRDATDETWVKVEAWAYPVILEYLKKYDVSQARTLEKGKRVRVVKGRKVPIGTTGTITWKGEVNYGYHSWDARTRLGIRDDAGQQWWTDSHNVELAEQWETYCADLEDLKAKARNLADRKYVVGVLRSLWSPGNCIVV